MRHHPNEYADSPKNDKCHQIANKIPVIVTFMTKHQQREKKRKLRTLGEGDGPLKLRTAFFCISYLSKKC